MLLEGTRYQPHIGNFNNITMETTSKVGAVDGYVGTDNPNINRTSTSSNPVPKTQQKGGGTHFGFSSVDVHAGGPTGGLISIQKGANCGISSDLNLNASKQHSNVNIQRGGATGYGYDSGGIARFGFDNNLDGLHEFRGSYAPIKSIPIPSCKQMIGGNLICNDLNKVKNFSQVHAFWASICPGAVMIYHNYLEKLEKTQKDKVLSIIKTYTKAFCHEVKALKSTNKKVIKQELQKLKNEMKKVEKMLLELVPQAKKMHKMVEKRHVDTVFSHYEQMSKKNKIHSKKHMKKHKNKTHKAHKSHKKTHKNKSHNKNKTMKGGYYQYGSNIPYTPNYAVSTDGGYKLGTPGATMNSNCVNCKDNYNHYDGSSHQTGVFDKDVTA
jgi:hypothetical protein